MNSTTPKTRKGTLLLACCLLLIFFTVALAQSGDGYDLIWSIAAGGGGGSTGGPYALGGTAGQAAAGMMSGGAFKLVGGAGVTPQTQYGVFMPVVAQGK